MTKQLIGLAGLTACLLVAPGCGSKHEVQTIEEAPRLASTVRMNDPAVVHQLVSGFHDVEGRAWRWTARAFAVDLRPPDRAAQVGAVLEFHFSIPKTSMDKLGSMTLKAAIGGTALPSETYTNPGDYTYRRDVSPTLLAGDSVRVDFDLDKAVPPGDVDKRELGVVAASVALVAK